MIVTWDRDDAGRLFLTNSGGSRIRAQRHEVELVEEIETLRHTNDNLENENRRLREYADA